MQRPRCTSSRTPSVFKGRWGQPSVLALDSQLQTGNMLGWMAEPIDW